MGISKLFRKRNYKPLVVIEAGDSPEYVDACMVDSIARGECPFPPSKHPELKLGWFQHADLVVIYIDKGILFDARLMMVQAKKAKVSVVYRTLKEEIQNEVHNAKSGIAGCKTPPDGPTSDGKAG